MISRLISFVFTLRISDLCIFIELIIGEAIDSIIELVHIKQSKSNIESAIESRFWHGENINQKTKSISLRQSLIKTH